MNIKNKLLLILIAGMFLFSFANVSAFLDTKNFDESVGKYGEIKFNDYWFLNKADYRLTDYGASVINVYAEGEYTLYKKTHLFTGIFYKDIMGTKGNLKNVNFYIWNEEFETRYNTIYENQNCYMDLNYTEEEGLFYPEMINESGIERCDKVLISNDSYEVDISRWILYEKGTKIDRGKGRWRLEAERPKNAKIDFVLEAHGEEFTEWAWFNDSWLYKREIGNLTGYFSYMEINKTEHMSSNFGDIRFVNTAGNIEMNYTIESYLDGQGYVYNSSASPYDNGLVSYYKLNENTATTTVADSHGVNTGVASKNTEDFSATGKINTAFDFDGIDDDVALFDFNPSAFSFSMWAKSPNTTAQGMLISAYDDGATWTKIVRFNVDKVQFFIRDVSTTYLIESGATIADDTWYHIVATYDGSEMILYINGVNVDSDSSPTGLSSADTFLRLGETNNGGGDLTGKIDEVGIFNRSLSESEVQSLYNASYAQFRVHNLGDSEIDMYYGNADVSTTSSVSDTYFEPFTMWYMDEESGTVIDIIDNFNGINTGATPNVAGKIDTAYDFELSESDWINIGMTDQGYDTITMSAWVKGESYQTAGWNYVVAGEGVDQGPNLIWSSTKWSFNVRKPGAWISVHFYTATPTIGQWYNIVGTFNGTHAKIYVDGDLKNTTIVALSTMDEFRIDGIGCWKAGAGRFFDGVIDEVSIYNKALTLDQIYQLYTQNEPAYTLGAEETSNTALTITANITKPDTVYPNTDYLVNLTIEDTDVGDTLTGYVKFYVNGTATSTEQSAVAVNGTTTLIATLSYGNFSAGDTLIAQVWAGDGTVNTTKVNLTSSTVSSWPSVTNLIEFPTDPATYSKETIYNFNATVTDVNTLDDVILEFNGTNYTATNMSADIFNVSFTNLSTGVYNYRWFANNSDGGINNTETGSYTINRATSQTSLTFNIPSPQTYGTSITPTCSVTEGEGSVILDMDGAVITSGSSIVVGAGTRLFNCSYAETVNYTGSQNTSSYTIDKATPTGTLTSDLGWIINESQEITIGLSEGNPNDWDVTYIVYRDNVSKGTGETWYPSYGTYSYVLNTTGGANWTLNANMDIETLIVNDNINPNIEIIFPINNSEYGTIITELNYTVNDTNLDTCWYSLNGGLANTTITCGDNVTGLNSGQGTSTWQIWANDSDNNINTTIVTFSVDTYSPNITILTEYPSDPATYSQTIIYQFNATVIDSSILDDIILEFNGVNYSASNAGNIFYVSLNNLSTGVYNYRWFANDTLGNFNNTEIGSYTVNKATPTLGLTATTPITYGTITDFSGSGCPAQLNCSLDIENNVYAVGIITGNYSTAGNVNYTSTYVNFTVTINKASLAGSITGTTPITYLTLADITANETNNNDSDVAYILHRDNITVSNPDTTTLGVGTYYYVYNSTGGANYTSNPSIDTFTLTVNKATGEVYAYVGNLRANYLGNNLTAKNEYLNGSLNVGLGNISMYLNNSLIASGTPPLFYITDFPLGSYYFNVTYDGDANYTSAEEHWAINISVWFLSNLTGVFNLNAGTGDVTYDISGNNNNGTIDGATWNDDGIEITLIDGFHYSVDTDTGLFILLDNALDNTFIEVSYTYFEYADDFLHGIVIKLLPGLLLMLVLMMIIRFFMGRKDDAVEVYGYDY